MISAAAAITIDINCDLGEGLGRWKVGDDNAMLDLVSSANVACGFHAGDPSIMRAVCHAAAVRSVAIGAHVSYQDLAGFGRRFIDADPGELRDAVTYQIGALDAFARAAGTRVGYVKPHGALYNAIVDHEVQAAAVVAGVVAYAKLPLIGLPGSVALSLAAAAGLRAVGEAFADRAYNPDGTLVPRCDPGAVLHDVPAIAERSVRIVRDHTVTAIDGTEIEVNVDSICVHGDTPGSVQIATALREALATAGITIKPFLL